MKNIVLTFICTISATLSAAQLELRLPITEVSSPVLGEELKYSATIYTEPFELDSYEITNTNKFPSWYRSHLARKRADLFDELERFRIRWHPMYNVDEDKFNFAIVKSLDFKDTSTKSSITHVVTLSTKSNEVENSSKVLIVFITSPSIRLLPIDVYDPDVPKNRGMDYDFYLWSDTEECWQVWYPDVTHWANDFTDHDLSTIMDRYSEEEKVKIIDSMLGSLHAVNVQDQ